MNDIINILKNSITLYDKNKIDNIHFLREITKISFYFVYNDVDKNKLKIYFNDKCTYNGPFELVGIFRHELRLWSWGWFIVGDNKNLIKTSQLLLNYSINKMTNDDELSKQIKEFFTKGVTILDNDIKKNLILSLIFYLSKAKHVVELRINENDYNSFVDILSNKEKKIKLNVLNSFDDDKCFSLFVIL